MNDTDSRYKKITAVLVIVLILNWLVAFAKIAFGLITHCSSIIADGFHSLSDGASNIIGLIGIRLAYRPEDLDHPYGHKKYETLFSLIIAALLFIVAFNLFKEGLKRIYTPVIPEVDIRSFAVMIITLCINLFVLLYERKRGETLKSDILISDSMHTKSDILVSLSVIIGLVVIKLGYPIFDPIATMVIALLIGHSGYQIISESSKVLCDSAAPVETKKIVDIVLSTKGVKTCHKIRTRGRSDDIHIDLHVQVDPDMHIDKAHRISYDIEENIKKGIPGVTDVIVHIEPREK